MATTTAADLIVPEVWGDAIMTTVTGRAVMLPLADVDDNLVGQPGDTTHFPKWNYIGDAEDLTENVAMDTTKLSMTDSFATIKEAGKAVELTDRAVLTAIDNPNDQARQQLGLSIARKIDTDIRAAAVYTHTNAGAGDPIPTTAPLALTAPEDGGVIGWNNIVHGLALLGDEYDPADIAGIVIHSLQHAALMRDPLFVQSGALGPNAALVRGQVGAIGTIPVILSDRTTQSTGAGVYDSLIIKRGALALKYKRRAIVETDRDILKRTNVITTNAHYAAHRTDDRGVIVLRSRAVAA